ncbi:MAG: hypothetical protein WC058_04620 [Phycisphaeraceae bacterium]
MDKFADVPPEARPLIRQSAIMALAAKDPQLKKRTLTHLYNQRPTWLKLAHNQIVHVTVHGFRPWQPMNLIRGCFLSRHQRIPRAARPFGRAGKVPGCALDYPLVRWLRLKTVRLIRLSYALSTVESQSFRVPRRLVVSMRRMPTLRLIEHHFVRIFSLLSCERLRLSHASRVFDKATRTGICRKIVSAVAVWVECKCVPGSRYELYAPALKLRRVGARRTFRK